MESKSPPTSQLFVHMEREYPPLPSCITNKHRGVEEGQKMNELNTLGSAVFWQESGDNDTYHDTGATIQYILFHRCLH